MNDKTQQTEHTNEAQTKKQNQDFPNLPASTEKQNPPDISKKDVKKTSDIAETGKTDNTVESGN